MTLRFLGQADAEQAGVALSEVSASVTDAVIDPRVRLLGRRVVCVGVAGLESLASAVIGATAQLGQMPDKRGFTGHITLARLDEGARPNPASVIPCRWTVGTFALVRSHLGGGPARYETVAAWPLQP